MGRASRAKWLRREQNNMTREVRFNKDDPKRTTRFKIILDAFNVAPSDKPRDRGIMRLEAKLKANIESISTLIEGETNTTGWFRNLNEGDQVIYMEQAELKLLFELIDSTPWRRQFSDVVADTIDFLDAAPEISQEKLKLVKSVD